LSMLSEKTDCFQPRLNYLTPDFILRDLSELSQIIGMKCPLTMKIMGITIVLAVFFPGQSVAFRCGNELVSINDTRDKVRDICGEPQSIETWTEERLRWYPRRPYDDPYRYYRHYHRQDVHPYPPTEIIRVEEWVYNLGRNRFIRYLRFENGRLKKIDTGGYGY
jgi:hypothetical protein